MKRAELVTSIVVKIGEWKHRNVLVNSLSHNTRYDQSWIFKFVFFYETSHRGVILFRIYCTACFTLLCVYVNNKLVSWKNKENEIWKIQTFLDWFCSALCRLCDCFVVLFLVLILLRLFQSSNLFVSSYGQLFYGLPLRIRSTSYHVIV